MPYEKLNRNQVLISMDEIGPQIWIDGQEMQCVESFKLERDTQDGYNTTMLTLKMDGVDAKVVFADGWIGHKIAAVVAPTAASLDAKESSAK